jgi:hypothetical protein
MSAPTYVEIPLAQSLYDPSSGRVGGLTFAQHKKSHVLTRLVSADVPQRHCPLCNDKERMRKNVVATDKKFSKMKTNFERTVKSNLPRDCNGKGVSVRRLTALDSADFVQGRVRVERKNVTPHSHRNDAPFKSRDALGAWLIEKFPTVMEGIGTDDPSAKFFTAAKYFTVGESYFLRGFEARDILSDNLQHFDSVEQIEDIIKAIRKKFLPVSAIGEEVRH